MTIDAYVRALDARLQTFDALAAGGDDSATGAAFSERLAAKRAVAEVPAGRVGRRPRDLECIFEAASRDSGVDPALLAAVAKTESGDDPTAISPAGAQGLMQLMPDTARALGVSDPFDPEQSALGGARYLASLLRRYGGNVSLALAAYNAGPGAVDRAGGVPAIAETENYVERVSDAYASSASAAPEYALPHTARSSPA